MNSTKNRLLSEKNSRVGNQTVRNWQFWWPFVIPLILGLVLMAPRVASAQFGLFDDGNTIVVSRQILSGEWKLAYESATGRFRPAYWIFNALIYALTNGRPTGFYIANTLTLCVITFLLMSIVYKTTKSRLQSSITAFVFLLSGPVVESFYTLSKAEPPQILWILVSIIIAINHDRFKSRSAQVLQLALIGLFSFLSMATKETSLVMIPIALTWLVGSWFYKKIFQRDHIFKISRNYASGVVLSGVVYLIVRGAIIRGAITEVGYARAYVMSLESILSTARQWIDWLNRDFLYLMPLAGIPVLAFSIRKRLGSLGLTLALLVWMVGWVVVFLPWAWTVEYFLLPFSIGAAIVSAVLLNQALDMLKTNRFFQVTTAVLIAASTVLFLLTIPNNITNARVQLAVDKANAEMLNFIVETLPINSKLIVNIQDPNEYYDQIALQLRDIQNRSDILVDYFREDDEEIIDPLMGTYIATPIMYSQYYLSVRLGIQAHTSQEWNISLQNFLNGMGEQYFQTLINFQMLRVDSIRLACFLKEGSSYCDVPNTPFDTRVFTYGWEIIELQSSQ